MSSIGPQVSVEKCELWSPNPELDTSLLPPEITVQKLGLKNLGAPVSGNHDFVQRMFSRRVEMGKELMESNRLLEDPQLELQLLRSCAALPKIIFSLRTCEPSSVYSPSQISTALFTVLLRQKLAPLFSSQHLQSSLPVSKGGIGLPIAFKLCHAAFLGSYVDTKTLADQIMNNSSLSKPPSLSKTVSVLQGHEPTIQPVPFAPKAQTKLTDIVNSSSWRECLATTEREKGELLSCSLASSGDWL